MGVKIEITLNAAILSKLGGKLFFYWLFFCIYENLKVKEVTTDVYGLVSRSFSLTVQRKNCFLSYSPVISFP